MKKLTVAVFMGGRSGEHEVSLISAKNIIDALDKNKYRVIPVGINKGGKWLLMEADRFLENDLSVETAKLAKSDIELTVSTDSNEQALIAIQKNNVKKIKIDVAIPALHGTFGEDGTIQGMFDMASIPYVGCDALGGSVGMDKDVMKRLLRDAGIPGPKFKVYSKEQFLNKEASYKDAAQELGNIVFVKPANLGSSVGISKVKNEKDWVKALEEAFKYDVKVIVEEAIEGREIECAVLGNDKPKASIPGEVIPNHEFYSYEAKYIDEKGAMLEAPAKLEKSQIKEVQALAIKVFKVLETKGLGRVDFFLTKEGKFLCNEINTFPGFTKISMYPRLWDLTGIPYPKLLDELIDLALSRAKQKNSLRLSVK